MKRLVTKADSAGNNYGVIVAFNNNEGGVAMRGTCQQLFRFASIAFCLILAACNGGGGGGGGSNSSGTSSNTPPNNTATFVSAADVPDEKLRRCLNTLAATNGWKTFADVTVIVCTNAPYDPLDFATISSLTGLEKFTNLEDLEIVGIGAGGLVDISRVIQDLTPLRNLIKLTFLNLDGNGIRDLEPLRNLIALRFLSLAYNYIDDVSPIAGLVNLELLDLTYNFALTAPLRDIQPLSSLHTLTYLALGSNEIRDITPLAGLSNLLYLDLSRNYIADFSSLGGLRALVYLDISSPFVYIPGNSLPSSLANLNNLTELYADYWSGKGDISAIQNLTKLEILSLGFVGTIDLTMLSRLNALRELYLPYASAINASALVGLTNITVLDLTTIHFADASNFSFLSQMPNLIGLSLRSGSAYFNDASFLANLVNLQVLDLGFIQFSNLSPLTTLSNLEVLALDFTRITDITPLSSLTNLRELDLSNTDVVELSPLVVLQGLQVLSAFSTIAALC